MLKLKSVVAAAVVAIALSALSAGVFASAPNTTYLTFSGPVSIPGVTLPAGTYIFERVDLPDRIDMVRVSARNRSHVYMTAFTRIVQRPRGLKSSQAVTFREGRPGAAPEIAAWFPMGAAEGHAFEY
jgi:hypothetical protein